MNCKYCNEEMDLDEQQFNSQVYICLCGSTLYQEEGHDDVWYMELN